MSLLLPGFTHTEACGNFESALPNPSPFVTVGFMSVQYAFACLECNFLNPGKVAGEGWRSGGACVESVVKSRKTCLRVVCEPHIWLSLALLSVALSRVALSVDART